MKTPSRRAVRTIAFAALLTLPLPLAAALHAQADAASMAAMQASQQANQQAMQASQQANQQAMQQATDNTSSPQSLPGTIYRQQQPPSAFPQGPVPPQIAAAHTIFLTNGGASANFPVDENTAYTDVYNALKSWGHYQLVETPQQADLIFSLRDIAPVTNVGDVGHNDVYAITSPAFRLSILDAKTNSPLWTVTSPAYITGSKKTRARWYSIAVANLISRVKVLAAQPLSTQETADLTTYPKNHFKRDAIIIAGSVVAAGAIAGILAHNAFDHSLANQKASQDKFCEAHNIPLSMCAGG